MKILNLYAGVGGNRKNWSSEHQVTAVEINESIAACYKDLYPADEVIIGDAHEFLLKHYAEYDFIWTSPPCQTHSRARQWVAQTYYDGGDGPKVEPVYPDMKLWQEIIFLKHHCKSLWVVENVMPYYKPLIEPSFKMGPNLFWSNKIITVDISPKRKHFNTTKELEENRGLDLSKYTFKGITKRQVLRNMVEPEVGNYILEKINDY